MGWDFEGGHFLSYDLLGSGELDLAEEEDMVTPGELDMELFLVTPGGRAVGSHCFRMQSTW